MPIEKENSVTYSSALIKGRIIKSIGGIYYTETENGILACKAKGLFRLKGVSPYVGDYVKVEVENNSSVICEIERRKNEFIRPPLSNLDRVVLVISLTDPSPNAYIIDKLIAILEMMDIEPVLAFTKIDRKRLDSFPKVYENAGFKTFLIDNTTGEGVDLLSEILRDKTSALIGNSGVGKSSLLNILLPHIGAATAKTSKKLGRGKHTTRHVELYHYNGGYIADTPGFSTVDATRYGDFSAEDLMLGFREFIPYIGKCPFKGCTHTGELECAIKAAISDRNPQTRSQEGKIDKSRYNSYVMIYNELKKAENTY